RFLLRGHDAGWRWMFFMNVPIGVAAILGAFKYIPDDRNRQKSRVDLDPIGTVLLAIAILLIMLPFLQRDVNVLIWMSFPAGLLVLCAWWAWVGRYRRKDRHPMFDPAISSQ